jgi:hypothetical protein
VRLRLRAAAVGLLLAAAPGCAALSDPAVRFAGCLEDAVAAAGAADAPVEVECDFPARGGGLLVLHPDGAPTDPEYAAAGLAPQQIAAVHALRLGPDAAIYVLPRDPARAPSRTTAQRPFVRFPRLLAASRDSASPLTLVLEGPPGRRAVRELR